MKKVLVFGAGMVGTAIALDLIKKHQVTIADISDNALAKIKKRNNEIQTLTSDLSIAENISDLVQPFDIIVCAVPGFMGFKTLETIINAGKNVVDISFFPENSLELHELAKQKGVTAIVDCGVAPGMDNIILGHYNEKLSVTDFECLVGGLPKIKKWPFNYKAPFSPVDVIEEYTRPARYVENGMVITKPALSDIEHVEIAGVGTLESFNSDGLRSIIYTMPHIPNMKEKTLRYPGHAQMIMALSDSGFFSKEPLFVNGKEYTPLDVTSGILFKEWKLGETEDELTVMRVSVVGTENGVKKKIIYHLFDVYNNTTQTSSMARCTGYTATAATELILKSLFTEIGVFPPELIGKYENCFDFILNYLKERGVEYRKEELSI